MDAAAIASAAHAVPVTTVGWSTTAIVSAVQTIIVTVLGGGGLYGLFKGVGYLWSISNQRAAQEDTRDAEARKQASEERAADFDRLREDAKEARADAKEARASADRAIAGVQRLENMIACMRPAISILTEEIKRLDPDPANNAALRQVRELMTMAAVGDFGVMPAMIGLAATKGVGE